LHLQTDRTLEVHTQGGFHYRTRIPQFGRSLAYHFPSCDALVAANGHEVYQFNLDQGRFMIPLDMTSGDAGDVDGVNVANVNPAHQLFAFGLEGNGAVQFWDPRSRTRVGLLYLPTSTLMPSGADNSVSLSTTAIASRSDGLSYAIGTSTGHTLLYDIRSPRPYAMKDQGYGLPVKCVEWVEGGNRVAGDGMVISADKKVVKIWDRNSVSVAQRFPPIILTSFAGQYKFCIRYPLCRYQPLAPRSRLRSPYAG
jgi:ribosome biogenesis protein ENP2